MEEPVTSTAPSSGTAGAGPTVGYSDYWANTSDCLFYVTVAGEDDFVYGESNPSTERLTGVPVSLSLGRRPADVMPPDSAEAVLTRYRQCVRERHPITYVETLKFPTGQSSWSTTLSPVVDAVGRVVRLVGCARQIPMPDEHALLAEVELQVVLDGLANGIALLDAAGTILFVNAAWRRFGARHGASPRDLGERYLDLCDRSDGAGLPSRPDVEKELRRLLDGKTEGFDLRYAWRDRRILLRASHIAGGGVARAAVAHTDITDMVDAQEVLARANENLLQIQEEERARIAQDLHDSTSQHLVAANLGLARLRRTNAPPEVLDDMRRALGEAHREIRTLTYLLYPPKLSREGLAATLRTFVDGFRRRTGLSVVSTTFGDIDELPLALQRSVFRVVQESLANIHRHAGAKRASIELSLKRRGLRLTVADDGGRAQPADRDFVSGVGIRGMQARFAHFGGELTVSNRQFGTVVDGFIPASGIRRAATLTG